MAQTRTISVKAFLSRISFDTSVHYFGSASSGTSASYNGRASTFYLFQNYFSTSGRQYVQPNFMRLFLLLSPLSKWIAQKVKAINQEAIKSQISFGHLSNRP